MVGASRKSRLRHYLNLEKTEGRFRSLLREFDFAPIGASLAGNGEILRAGTVLTPIPAANGA
jgi:hypothetical protein